MASRSEYRFRDYYRDSSTPIFIDPTDRYHKVKPVAANISLIVIVLRLCLNLHPGLIDRYLVACADADIPALLVLNKSDLLKENDPILDLLKEYQDLGYEVMQTSPMRI